MGRLVSMIVMGCVNVSWSISFCSCMMCAACVMSHASILRSGDLSDCIASVGL